RRARSMRQTEPRRVARISLAQVPPESQPKNRPAQGLFDDIKQAANVIGGERQGSPQAKEARGRVSHLAAKPTRAAARASCSCEVLGYAVCRNPVHKGPLSAQLRRPRPRSATSAIRRFRPSACSGQSTAPGGPLPFPGDAGRQVSCPILPSTSQG